MRALVIAGLLLLPRMASGGYAKQETDFHLDVAAEKVCEWIEHHPADIERAAGAVVVTEREDMVKLDRTDERGRYIFWVKRSAVHGKYREVMVESVSGGLTRWQTDILVTPNAEGGCDVTIRMTATVDDVANVKIAVACRRAIKGMRALVEKTFGQPLP